MNSATATTIAAGSIEIPDGHPPPRKKNAASQFRSRRKRISHPLLGSPAPISTAHPSTPIRPENTATECSTPPRTNFITPDAVHGSPEPPALIDALKMAARPSGPAAVTTVEGILPRASYASSIEAMAAHVEACHSTRKRSPKRNPNSRNPLSIKKRSSGGGSVTSGRSQGTRKPSKSKAARRAAAAEAAIPHRKRISNAKKMWLIAIPILLPFMVCETFLWFLVFRFKDSVGEMVVGSSGIPMPEVSVDKIDPITQSDIVKEVKEPIVEDSEIDSTSTEDDGLSEQDLTDEAEPQAGGTSVEPETELMRLHSMLEEGFGKLRGSEIESDKENNGSSVERLCGNVWVAANDMLSSESHDSETVDSLGEMAAEEASLWKSLALDAQHCIGGAGLAFLAKGHIDRERLRVSTEVFDRLSQVEPHNPDVRAGLGTSLLIQGIFENDGSDSAKIVAQPLLSLASYHLKVASSLCASSHDAAVGNGNLGTPIDTAPALSRLTTSEDDENSASQAAILHNLALAYLALGDTDGSIPFLLRAAAICREYPTDMKPYWNAPNSVLRAAEEKALLLAVKLKPSGPVEKKRRIPFLPSFSLNVEEMGGI